MIPARLTPESVATPLPFVIAPPTLEPLSVKLTVSPDTPTADEVSVALSVVVPPKVPVAAATARLVALVAAVSTKQTWTLESDGVTALFVVVSVAWYLR